MQLVISACFFHLGVFNVHNQHTNFPDIALIFPPIMVEYNTHIYVSINPNSEVSYIFRLEIIKEN
jgi:hypothetical protein